MTDLQIADRIVTFMRVQGWRTIRLASLADRYTLADEGQVERAIRLAPGLTVEFRGGDLWVTESSVRRNDRAQKGEDGFPITPEQPWRGRGSRSDAGRSRRPTSSTMSAPQSSKTSVAGSR